MNRPATVTSASQAYRASAHPPEQSGGCFVYGLNREKRPTITRPGAIAEKAFRRFWDAIGTKKPWVEGCTVAEHETMSFVWDLWVWRPELDGGEHIEYVRRYGTPEYVAAELVKVFP